MILTLQTLFVSVGAIDVVVPMQSQRLQIRILAVHDAPGKGLPHLETCKLSDELRLSIIDILSIVQGKMRSPHIDGPLYLLPGSLTFEFRFTTSPKGQSAIPARSRLGVCRCLRTPVIPGFDVKTFHKTELGDICQDCLFIVAYLVCGWSTPIERCFNFRAAPLI